MRFRRISFPISALLSIAAIALYFFHGLNFGIDFVGGTLMEVQTKAGPADLSKMRATIGELKLGDFQLQEFGAPNDVLIRISEQPGGDEAQQAALTQLSSNDPATFAPSSQGDMAHPTVDPKYDRQLVDYRSEERPGTIVIDTPHHFLFLVQDNGKAMRYGIGVGRPGFTWEGVKTISAKKEWPDWRPPPEMIQRRPDLPRYMAGGPENPLGARAMYLGSTVYRIHGSNEPWTIGSNVSSGCIRLRNADVIDLYNRVQVGTKVVVM